MVMIHETCRLYPYTIGLCHPAYRPFLALAMTCRAARVLEGGINMRNRNILSYGSPIFKAVPKKRCKALYRALKKSPKSPELAVGAGSEPSYVDRSVGAP